MTTTARERATRPPAKPAKPISFDERLALASLAVDARINTEPLDLADVIRLPVEAPRPVAPNPYRTPIASALHRARVRLENGGWCKGTLRDEEGAACMIGAIRAETAGRGQADDACAILREAIRRDFHDAEIPSWNDAQKSSRLPLIYLDRAAQLAHSRGK